MCYRRLFIFVEGNDDDRFFQSIIVPKLEKSYDNIEIVNYAQMKKEKTENYLRSAKSMGDYIFVSDINSSPCVTEKKQKLCNEYNNLDEEKIVIVVKEIESWYLAGLDGNSLQDFRNEITDHTFTETITKEDFNKLIPRKYDSRIDFMQEVLKHFSIDVAKQKSRSFKYFYENYIGYQ